MLPFHKPVTNITSKKYYVVLRWKAHFHLDDYIDKDNAKFWAPGNPRFIAAKQLHLHSYVVHGMILSLSCTHMNLQ
jgi:hypothetical protein